MPNKDTTTNNPKTSHHMFPNTAMAAHQVELVEIDENQAILSMPITDATRQPYGLWHGGMSMFLAESAASMHAVYGVDMAEKFPVGIEISGSHISSAKEGTVKAVATVIRRTRSLIFHKVDIIHVETGKLMCSARVTNFYKFVAK